MFLLIAVNLGILLALVPINRHLRAAARNMQSMRGNVGD